MQCFSFARRTSEPFQGEEWGHQSHLMPWQREPSVHDPGLEDTEPQTLSLLAAVTSL